MNRMKVVIMGLMLSSSLFGSVIIEQPRCDACGAPIQMQERVSGRESVEKMAGGGPLTADTLIKRGYIRIHGFQVMNSRTYSNLHDIGRIIRNMGVHDLHQSWPVAVLDKLAQETVRSAYGYGVRFGEYIRLTGISMESAFKVLPNEIGRVLRDGFIFAGNRFESGLGIEAIMQVPRVFVCMAGFHKEFMDGVRRGYDRAGETM